MPGKNFFQMKQIFFLFLFVSVSTSAIGQFQDRYWIFGRTNYNSSTNASGNQTNINMEFYNSSLLLYNSANPPAMTTQPNKISDTNGFESWSIVTNPTNGNLLFYSDGRDVFDASHAKITPVGGLGASPSSTQPVAVCVVPVCPFNQYYIFSNPTGLESPPATNGPITYRIYTVGGGFSASQNLPGQFSNVAVGEGMIIIPSKTDPYVFWLITRDITPTATSSKYLVYKIDGNGINYKGTYTFGPPIPGPTGSPISSMAFRDDGSANNVTVGITMSGSPNRVFTNKFNTNSGDFIGPVVNIASIPSSVSVPNLLYDLEFSPNGQFIYFATYYPSVLYQADMNGNVVTMNNFENGGNTRAGGLKLAPDGYIYHIANAGNEFSTGTVSIGRIIKPNLQATTSNFSTMYEANVISRNNVYAYNFCEFVNIPSWNATVTIQGDNLICPGDKKDISCNVVSLGVVVEGYDWYLNGTLLSTTTTPTISATSTGNYFVIVKLKGGCTIKSNVITINQKENCTPPIKFDPCCPPMNTELMKNMFNFEPGSTLTSPYKIKFTPTTQFITTSQAYCDYIKTLYPNIGKLTFSWELRKADGCETGKCKIKYGEPVGQNSTIYNWFVPGGNGTINSQTNFFNETLEINRCYGVHVGIFTEPASDAFKVECSNNTLFCFRIQVFNGMRKAILSDGKKVIAEYFLDKEKKKN